MANTFTPTALANGTSNLLVRASAINQTTDLLQAGVVFNDAVRISTGLFSTPQNSGNSNPFLGSYTTDLHAVQNDIAAMLATPGNVTINGNAFTLNATDTAVLTNVQAQIGQLLAAAPQTTNPGTLAAADQTIHNVQAQILQEIQGDAHLSGALNQVTFMANTGANDVAFQSLPAGNDSAANLAAATGGDFKAVGEVFNAAADLVSGGISANNLGQVTADFTAARQGLLAILNSPSKLAAIEKGETAVAAATTTLHLQTVSDQLSLQLNKYDANEVNASPTALRGTADNVLDIIDIVQNDANLNAAGGGTGTAGHIGGFAEMPGGLTGTVTKFQDNQAQTNFWANFLAEANTLSAKLTAVANGTATATQDMITQITNYQNFGVQFDLAQGAVFQGRFDNELVHGGLQSDSTAAMKALTGILNGDTGAALAADHAMLTAAAQGFVGNAGDIAGNNVAIGGSAYVGSATSFITATAVNGIAMGTGQPVGANPNIANGTGGTVTTPGGGGAMTNTFTPTALANGTSNLLVRASALNQTTDLLQAGAVFNDAVRASTGLFSTPQNSGNSNPFLGSFTTDIHAVQNDIAAMLANPGTVTINGNAFTLNAMDTQVLTTVQNQLTQILNAAPQTTNAGTLAAADQIIHTNEMQILQEINGDAHLANALGNVTFLANTGAIDVAFQGLPVGADDAATLANATAGTSLKAVGSVFNAAADLALGGINANNLTQIQNDFTAVEAGLKAILANPNMLAAIEKGETAVAAQTTTLHLQTVADQITLQLNKYDANEVNANPTALRGTADNILDIIDIVQNDANLNVAAGGNGTPGHVGGFAEMPGGLTGTVTKFQDNQAQTNFWATFLSEANTLAAQLTKVANGTGAATQDLVTQITNYQNFGVQFDMAQGAVFQGRFDNELVHGGLQSDSNAAIKALTGILNGDTGAALAADHAMLTAAAQGFQGNAGDIAGNNIAIGGSAYVGSATTIATATVVNGIGMGTGKPVGATPNIANGTGGAPATSTSMAGHGHDADDHSSAAANAGGAKQSPAPAATAANTHATQPAAASHATGATHAMITMHDLMHAEAVAHQMHWA